MPEKPGRGKPVTSRKAESASQTEMPGTEDENEIEANPTTSNFGTTPILPKKRPKITLVDSADDEQSDGEKTKSKPKRLSKKDLPRFDGKPGDDALLFMNRYEMVAKFNDWGEKERIDHLHMCFDHAAFSWLMGNINKCKKWGELKTGFLLFFGKGKDDFVLEKLSAKKYAIKDPNMFICQVIDYLATSEPRASDIRKADALYDALPRKLKIKFLESDRPKSVDEFSAKLKRIARAAKARMRYEDSSTGEESEGEEHKDKKETQTFAIMTDMRTQVAKLTSEMAKVQTDHQPPRHENRPKPPGVQRPPNTDQDRANSKPTCYYCKHAGHSVRECRKLAWVEKQPWYTGRRNERDSSGKIIFNTAEQARPDQRNHSWQPASQNANQSGK